MNIKTPLPTDIEGRYIYVIKQHVCHIKRRQETFPVFHLCDDALSVSWELSLTHPLRGSQG